MNLLALQRVFMSEISASDEDGAPTSTGMAVYRDAYRGRLLDALAHSFERTRRWVGADPFTAAASHYILAHPPHSWTLDDFGAAFPALLAGLFRDNPEAAELAWLEWHMQRAFAAPDSPGDVAGALSGAGLPEEAWAGLRFTMATGFAARGIATNVEQLWPRLADSDGTGFDVAPGSGTLIVWRQGLTPRYRLLGTAEQGSLLALAEGRTLGEAFATVAEAAVAQAGAWLGQWLADGLFSAYHTGAPETEARPETKSGSK